MTMYVVIENKPDGQYMASFIGLPMIQAQGESEDEALLRLRSMFMAYFRSAKIVALDIESDGSQNPWIQLSDQLKNNPLVSEVAESIATYRYELDVAESAHGQTNPCLNQG